MSVSTQYVLHGVLNSSSFLSQISNARVLSGLEYLIGQPAGLPNPMFVANIGALPQFSFDTTQLTTLCGLGGTSGYHLIDLSAANTDLYFKKTANLSTRVADATTEHIRMRAAMACLSIDRISAGHRTEASASCTLSALYNGSALPLVPTGSVALSGTPSSAVHWIAGKVTLTDTAGSPVTTTVAGVQDITIEFNRQAKIAGGEGEQYATHGYEQSVNPIITVKCLDTLWATIGANGTALGGFSVYLRKCSTTGPVATGTAQHIRFYGTAGIVAVDETASGGNEPGMTTLRITPVAASASADAMTIDTASTIA